MTVGAESGGTDEVIIVPIVPDNSVYEAKIAELTSFIAERDSAIGGLTADLSASKAANYDLLMNGPLKPFESQNETPINAAEPPRRGIDSLFD